MNKISSIFSEMYNELMNKVSWPSWEDLQGSLIVVTIATIIISLVVMAMNEAANIGMTSFYHLFQ
jgi:preprotein translocase subunit SecE